MSVASEVPETWSLSGDDAWNTLLSTGRVKLARDGFQRMRAADGFSHARSLAFLTALVSVQGIITLVGLASALRAGASSDLIVRTLRTAVPGPAGQLLTEAVNQAHRAGATHRYVALIVGGVSMLVTGSTLMGQVERGLNRLYGIEQDRPTLRKYGRALLLASSAGLFATMAFVAIAIGRSIASSLATDAATRLWNVSRWPVALLLSAASVALLFKWSPRRRQPAWSWLAFGVIVSVGLWTLASMLLGLYFGVSASFGKTYGPVAGIVALLVWSLLSSIALLYGAAVGAQLEAVRAGSPAPRDSAKSRTPKTRSATRRGATRPVSIGRR